MSGDSASEAPSADAPDSERLRAVPVVDLRPVLGVAEEDSAAPAPSEPAPAPPSAPKSGGRQDGGWLVPFSAGLLLGAGGFYAALWALALI